jgi:isoleucyl-tRNA synthetase
VALFITVDLAEIAITSAATVDLGEGPQDAFRLPDVPGAAAMFHGAEGRKCARCWMILPEVGSIPHHDDLCRRCSNAVGTLEGAAA